MRAVRDQRNKNLEGVIVSVTGIDQRVARSGVNSVISQVARVSFTSLFS